MIATHLTRLALLRVSVLCIVSLLISPIGSLYANAEDNQQTVILKSGRKLQGTIKKTGDNEITLTAREAGGVIEYPFLFEQIDTIDFHDEAIFLDIDTHLANGEKAAAHKRLSERYQRKARYFSVLRNKQIMQFYPLIDLHLELGDPYAAIGVGTNMLPFIRDSEQQQTLSDTLLMAHYYLPLKEKAEALADERISNSPRYGVSALPWYIKGQLAFDQGNYEQALLFALDPIVFSSQFPMNYLEHCYALAIATYSKLNETDSRKTLAQEMHSRGLPWPEIDTLAEYQTLSHSNHP